MPHPYLDQVRDALWPADLPRWGRIYAVLDNARDSRIYEAIEDCRLPKSCLFAGNLPFSLLRAAPYLVELKRDSPFTRFLITEGWGDSWGVFVRTDAGFEKLRRHFRHFLRVQDESGRRMIFRWYDPRVLRVYLPTCEAHEFERFLGPVERFIMEGDEPDERLEFCMEGGGLMASRQKLLPAWRASAD